MKIDSSKVIIERIEVMACEIPLVKPYKLSKNNGVQKTTHSIIVKIHTNKGIVGIGETNPQRRFSEELPETVILALQKYLIPDLIGVSPINIAMIHQLMDESLKGFVMAKAAIDMACYDILGKYSNLPVSELLGGRINEKLEVLWAIGNDAPDDSGKQADKICRDNYKTIMIKVGSGDFNEDVARVFAVRENVGADTALIVDANQGFKVEEAIKFAYEIRSANVALFEQPVAYYDLDGMKQVKDAIDITVSADESVFTFQDAKRVIEKNAADVLSIKMAKNGGIFWAREIVKLAEYSGKKVMFNSMLEEGVVQAASMQLALTTKNLWGRGHSYFSPLRLEEDITDFTSQIRNGFVFPNESTGLGVSLEMDKIEKYKYHHNIIE
ncbi:mandelate racemase/muconate lactonizing enzyme family protein [Acidaminobacter hydrogenoformans]|uniref:mandelate racemase/muconate lactonizing enzyme family protein n=1 Tax=Acidaminobacter hydrogenoformans TaxID=65403 RepID=UPI001480FB54|nr:enolase C-terminal domain-like protein [Acidaminobacter hydrogenoformans]